MREVTMELAALGFDRWFEEQAAPLLQPGHTMARVTAVDRGAFLVRDQDGETYAELSGKFRFGVESAIDLPCVGDWVCVKRHASGGPAMIYRVVPRRTFLRRKCAGEQVDFQMIAANVDVAFVVQSCHFDFNLRRLDRYLVMAADGGAEPMILLTKSDLIAPEELERTLADIRQSGATAGILALSSVTGAGFDELRRVLVPGRTYCLLGSSGVGKTTIINHLIGHDTYDTQTVSGTGEGTHTTARRQLIALEQGAMLIDTPGMRELGLLDAAGAVDQNFEDIRDLSASCRYANCSHTQEPGCAVLAAIENGELTQERYDSYVKLKKESEYHAMSYADKRKKDKAFGRLVKSVTKNLKK